MKSLIKTLILAKNLTTKMNKGQFIVKNINLNKVKSHQNIQQKITNFY